MLCCIHLHFFICHSLFFVYCLINYYYFLYCSFVLTMYRHCKHAACHSPSSPLGGVLHGLWAVLVFLHLKVQGGGPSIALCCILFLFIIPGCWQSRTLNSHKPLFVLTLDYALYDYPSPSLLRTAVLLAAGNVGRGQVII